MTAVTVLLIMLTMLGQILALADQAWINGRRNVNDFTKSRALLDMFCSDIQAGVFRNDVAAFPSTPTPASPNPSGPNIEFYTKRPGIPSGTSTGTVRSTSLIQYFYNTNQTTTTSMTTLERGDMAILWNSSASLISFGTTNPAGFGSNTITAWNTASGVIDYRALFVYADGSVSTSYPSPSSSAPALSAVALTLAVMDDQTLLQLSPHQVTTLRSALDGQASGTRSIKADWEQYLSGSSMSWSSYPKATPAGLKVFERYVTIPSF